MEPEPGSTAAQQQQHSLYHVTMYIMAQHSYANNQQQQHEEHQASNNTYHTYACTYTCKFRTLQTSYCNSSHNLQNSDSAALQLCCDVM
jgi:hypothetical protein